MMFRFLGIAPVLALAAAGVVHAQTPPSTGGGGQMAYPDSLPSGQVKINAPTARDTGNMAYPASPGGVSATPSSSPDTGNMAYPAGGPITSSSRPARPGMTKAATAAPAAPASGPTPAGMAAAKALADKPGSAPVPYVDFDAPAATMKGKGVVMHHTAAKPVAAKTAEKKPATPAATPAPAPAVKK
jgi:hypothetical protein